MGFGGYARQVRDADLPLPERYRALRCAVERYMPLGFNATWHFITRAAGDLRREPAAPLAALEVLETSREAWHAELADFAARRTAEKRDHRRTVAPDENTYRFGWRWPGPDAHRAMSGTVADLWHGHPALPRRMRAARSDLARSESAMRGIVAAYLADGRLGPEHRRELPPLLDELRTTGAEHCDRADRPWTTVGLRPLIKTGELIAHDVLPLVRRGWTGDAERVAEVFGAARARMTYLPRVHTDDETRWWIREVMIPQSELWIAELHGRPVGFAALSGDWLDHLYVDPAAQGAGIGTALLERARRRRPRELNLHVFQRNTGALAFYARHGFEPVSEGDGSGNEEGLPDAHLRRRS